jgi:hypothetical protein
MSGSVKPKAVVHVIFTEAGIPRWFGPEPVSGSEALDLEELRPFLPDGAAADGLAVLWRDILITHCRIEGRWSLREAVAAAESGGDQPAETVAAPEPAPAAGDGSSEADI